MTQFCTSESASTRLLRKTLPSSSYRTFASGGYIIRIRPTAIGIDVVPTLMRSSARREAGHEEAERRRRAPIARKIQSVR